MKIGLTPLLISLVREASEATKDGRKKGDHGRLLDFEDHAMQARIRGIGVWQKRKREAEEKQNIN